MDTGSLILALTGGALLGLAAGLLWLTQARLAGVSGILAGLVEPRRAEVGWRAAFVVGLLAGGVLLLLADPAAFPAAPPRAPWALAAAGLLVGFGARLSGGCTSGHGVCGVGRLSRRSIVATVTFIAAGAVSVAAFNGLLGGTP
jgi:uncharacterized membrane protein YedE/YeeE